MIEGCLVMDIKKFKKYYKFPQSQMLVSDCIVSKPHSIKKIDLLGVTLKDRPQTNITNGLYIYYN